VYNDKHNSLKTKDRTRHI